MSFHTKVNGPGWGVNDVLTSAQANQFDANQSDQRDWYFVRTLPSGAYTLDASGQDHVLLCAPTAAPCAITLPAASATRVVRVKLQSSGGGSVEIHPNGTDTIEGLNAVYLLTQVGSEVTLVGITGGWAIVGKGTNLASQTWTATTSSAWTAPAGCYFIELEMCGGGGGAAGGAAASTSTSQGAGGGPGGGGAPLFKATIPVTPGQAYDVTVGGGGTAGTAGNAGGDGGSSSVRPHAGANIAFTPGGGGGTKPATAGAGLTLAPGGTIAGAAQSLGSSWAATSTIAPQSAGGFGSNGLSSVASSDGSPSPINLASGGGQNQGTHAATGTASGSFNGGGGGAGGGGGPYGNGANGGAGGNGNGSGAGGNGTSGSAAASNTGGGGGGGGAGGFGSSSGGTGTSGGAGGSGQVTIRWRE